jgi:hypothetical protein
MMFFEKYLRNSLSIFKKKGTYASARKSIKKFHMLKNSITILPILENLLCKYSFSL